MTHSDKSDPAAPGHAEAFGVWKKRDRYWYEHLFQGQPSGWTIAYASGEWELFGPDPQRPGKKRPFALHQESPAKARAWFEAQWPFYKPV
ncbi:hypothetical protein CEK28_08490 [Xenophilus sp. AP218F]|nr:hypothetical protein CEK28_08490 [Xenophilus sp. AP218F]